MSIPRRTSNEEQDDVAVEMAQREVTALPPAYGSVEGIVGALASQAWDRDRLRFTLYDDLRGETVACFLEPDRTDLLRAARNRRALVRGLVYRDAETGWPIAIDPVEEIEIIKPVPPGSYKRARGISPPRPDVTESSVETIRRLRGG